MTLTQAGNTDLACLLYLRYSRYLFQPCEVIYLQSSSEEGLTIRGLCYVSNKHNNMYIYDTE